MIYVYDYAPKTLDDLSFNKKVINELEIISKSNSMPNTILFGSNGVGKETLSNALLEMLYGPDVHNLVESTYSIEGNSNPKKIDVVVKQSNYHIILELNNNNFDKNMIQYIIKLYAKRKQFDIFTSKTNFKTVLIKNVENMPYSAQTSLRRTMEIYSHTCRFIMWTNSISKVIEPLHSRCIMVRIPAPTNDSLFSYLYLINMNRKLEISFNDLSYICDKSDGNIKKALLMLELKHETGTFTNNYDEFIIDLVNSMLKCKNINTLLQIRNKLYNTLITNIPNSNIIVDMIKELNTKNIKYNSFYQIVKLASSYEFNLTIGRRDIMHLEPLIFNAIKILYVEKTNKKI